VDLTGLEAAEELSQAQSELAAAKAKLTSFTERDRQLQVRPVFFLRWQNLSHQRGTCSYYEAFE
jgi:hypothetical protein